jgi:hypothetical protein
MKCHHGGYQRIRNPLSLSCLLLFLVDTAEISLVVPVVDAFTTLPSKYSSALRGGCCYPTNDDDDSSHCGAWLRDTSPDQPRRQGNRLTTWQLGSTKKRKEEPKAGAAQTTAAATTYIQNKFDKQWLQHFEELKAFQKNYGHCNVSQRPGRLDRWVAKQRWVFKEDRMREDRKELLDEIGFVWNQLKEAWQSNYEHLLSYKKENGNCNVPRREGNLGLWVKHQRKLFNCDRMTIERIDLLEEIGFVWDPLDETWQNNYKELEEFQHLHGHVNVPKEDPLSDWTSKQRLDHAAGRLDPNKKIMFDGLGLVWEHPGFERHERQWLEMFCELEQYKLVEGHVRVPVNTSSLGRWVSKQRTLYHDGRLLEHRQAKLESTGFIWRLREEVKLDTTTWDKKWMTKYEALKEFQEEHGHANVPCKEGSLGNWVNRQRPLFRKDKLREDRKELLEAIGFEWKLGKVSSDERWQAKYAELQSYKKEFGHMDVSSTENFPLYKWISRQRILQQAGRLGSKRTAMLDDLGMEW